MHRPRFLRSLLAASFVSAVLVACSSSSTHYNGDDCVASGGKCVTGGGPACVKAAPSSAQDCNIDLTPNGAMCCADVAGDAR